jgi:cellulose synthase/poly-beta-1,6-N-acetylglucosamine synthase-like glycosyltransferase
VNRSKIVVLVAAHNEERSIVPTLKSLLAQDRRASRIVVAADNCSDNTVALAKSVRGVTVFETKNNSAKKPGALNQAWRRYCKKAEFVVCIDADTLLPSNAIADWEAEFLADATLGGCSAKFTMLVSPAMTKSERLLVRLQRAEFSKWTDLALRRNRRTSVLAGTACCINNDALREVSERRVAAGQADGPWTESSMVEDFELTYRLRGLGWTTRVSASVRAYTDAMTDLRSLWAQRMKWQTGTVSDLLAFGANKLTRFDWWQQAQGALAVFVRGLWVTTLIGGAVFGNLRLNPWWLLPPIAFVANDIKQAFRIPHRDRGDIVVAALLLPQELFAFMRAGWFLNSWVRVLGERLFGISHRDGWSRQAEAEARRRFSLGSGYAETNLESATPAANAA